ELGGIIDGVGLAAHIALPRIRSAFPPASGFFFTPECTADLGPRRADIDIGNAAIGTGRRQERLGLAHIGGKDTARQALWHAVLQRYSLIERPVRHDVENGGKGLVLNDGSLLGDFDKRWTHIMATGNCLDPLAA